MKTLLLFICAFCINASCPSALFAGDYTDFLPKYRSQNKNFILTKIDYTSTKMIIHFQYVAPEDGSIVFGGVSTDAAWMVYTSTKGVAGASFNASLENIKINGVLKADKVQATNKAQFLAKKGEVVMGEAHFSKLDRTIRSIHFAATGITECLDILIKEEGNTTLGTTEQMNASVERFYNMLTSFGTKVIRPSTTTTTTTPATKELNTIDLGKKTETKTTTTTANNSARIEPLKYTPKDLTSVKDMECETRVILKNVYFNDNSAEYAGRVEALKTIQIIVDYMKLYPQSTITLHGHTDIFGNPSSNMELSNNRVVTVKRTITQLGIAPERIATVSHGSTQPLPNFVTGGEKNRRVEVEVVCKKQ